MKGITHIQTGVYRPVRKSHEPIKKTTDPIEKTDRLEKSPSVDSVTYYSDSIAKAPSKRNLLPKERSDYDKKIFNNAIKESERTLISFRKFIREILRNQAKYYSANSGLTDIGVPKAAADEIQRLSGIYGTVEWTGEVGSGDYWGVDATAQRIFDFALKLSGGDEEKLAILKDAISKAFSECERLFGGALPEISYQTRDKIDSLFQEYLEG